MVWWIPWAMVSACIVSFSVGWLWGSIQTEHAMKRDAQRERLRQARERDQ